MKMSVNDSACYSILTVEELTKTALGSIQKADFSDLVGTWVPDPGFDDVISSQRQIDPEKWK